MRRTRRSSTAASAILTADLHLTEHTPVCRTDDYLAAQERKLAFLRKLREQNNNCPILVAGDIFEKWKNSPWFIYWAYKNLPNGIVTIPGNHELRFHSFKEYPQSTLYLLENLQVQNWSLTVLKNEKWSGFCKESTNKIVAYGTPFGVDVKLPWQEEKLSEDSCRRVLILHDFVWDSEQKPPWATGVYSPKEILDKFGKYADLILTGHNHESFTAEKNGTILVNPGSMVRNAADQADFLPRCFLYYANKNKAVPVNYPIEEGVVSQEHLHWKKQHEKRTSAYISQINMKWKKGLSYRDNLKTFFAANQTPTKVREILWQHLPEQQT